jgi:hypothetical protein
VRWQTINNKPKWNHKQKLKNKLTC